MTKERGNAAPSHATNFNAQAVTPAATAIRAMWPGKSSREIAEALGGRITPSNVRQWRTGARPIPPWVRDIMRDWTIAVREALEAAPKGNGREAGWRNLGSWRASRNSER